VEAPGDSPRLPTSVRQRRFDKIRRPSPAADGIENALQLYRKGRDNFFKIEVAAQTTTTEETHEL
jgi:hypothetical protein